MGEITGSSGKSNDGSDSSTKIVANLFISFVGAGILGLSYAFKEAGILEGVLIMGFVGGVSVKAMLLIIDCKYKIAQDDGCQYSAVRTSEAKAKVANGVESRNLDPSLLQIDSSVDLPHKDFIHAPDMNYGDVAYYALGNTGTVIVDILLVVSQIGFCCAYLIFISENLSSYFHRITKTDWLLLMLFPLFLLTLLRQLHSLAISSLFAQVSNMMAFLVVFWFDFEHFSHVRMHPKEFSLKGFPFFFSVSLYCYEGAGMILSLEQSVARQRRHEFRRFFVSTMVGVTLLYIVFGACGYLSFGAETNAIITLNLPKGSTVDFAMIVKTCLCLSLFCTYPVMMFPVTQMLESRLLGETRNRSYEITLRVILVGMTGVIVLMIPNFANLMALVGATCCTMLAFILPGLFHFQIFKRSLSTRQKFFDVLLILLGIIATVIGTIDTLKRMYEDTGMTKIEVVTLNPLVNSSSPIPVEAASQNSTIDQYFPSS